MKILVTDGNNRAALAITRSLGIKGHTVVVGEHKHPSLASSSKYCSDRITYPNPTKNPDEFIQELIRITKEKGIDVLLPVSDVTTIPVCKNMNVLEQYCKVPFSDPQSINLAANKSELFKVAQKLGVAVPNTVWLNKHADISQELEKLSYPVVVKPSKSRIKTDKGWISTAVKYAENQKELHLLLSKESPLAYPLLLQERIFGPGIGVFVCYNNGDPIAFFSHRRIREKPPSGGVSVLRESIAVSPVARDYSERLLSHLKWHGVAMVEFKLDNRDNIPKLMEINGRFWGSLQLAIDAGVDFPALLLETVKRKDIQPVTNYSLGVRTRWLLGDIDSLLMVLFKNKKNLKLPVGHRGKMKYMLEFFRLWEKDTNYEVLSRKDPRPWFFEFQRWLTQSKHL